MAPAVGLSAASGSSVNASPPNDTVYTVVGTDANSCIDSTTVSVQISTAAPVASFSASDTSVCVGNDITFNNTSTDAISFGWLLPGGTTADTSVQNPVVTYDSAGVFNVTLTAVGCSVDSMITKAGYITVNPIYSINTPDETICDGDSVMIFNIYQTIAGTYYDSSTTANGCDSIITTTLIVNPLPTVNLGADTICNGCSITLDAGAALQAMTGQPVKLHKLLLLIQQVFIVLWLPMQMAVQVEIR
ncbi:MAG: PKD domain-containing protein [Bacteroidetes bacterium]|nr:PKD domain-containing protein [Bacteroidota bacterium]